MATLEDAFLEDFDGSDDDLAASNLEKARQEQENVMDFDFNSNNNINNNNSNIENNEKNENNSKDETNNNLKNKEKQQTNNNNGYDSEDDTLPEFWNDMEMVMDIDLIETFDNPVIEGPSVETVSDLLNSDRLREHLKKIYERSQNKIQSINNNNNNNNSQQQLTTDESNNFLARTVLTHYGSMENEIDYNLIVESNKLINDIDNHIFRIHKFMKDIYATKFCELEEMIQHPIEYAKCVKLIANKTSEQMSDLPLANILSNPSVAMMVRVTASTTAGKQLQETDLKRVMHAADVMIALEEKKTIIVEFVSSRMNLIAPNVSALIGSELTANLVATVGGIEQLSNIPACNLQVLGASKRPQDFSQKNKTKKTKKGGFAVSSIQPHFGILSQSEFICNLPRNLQQKGLRLLASKVILCARIDAFSTHKHKQINPGQRGYELKLECQRKINKWQEPPPAKPPRPFKVPDNKPKKKRGGKRYRKMREKYKITETQKMQNRVGFNKPEEEVIDGDGRILGIGMLGSAADVGGQLRVVGGGKGNAGGGGGGPGNTELHKIHRRQIVRQKRMRMKAEKAGTVSGLHTSLTLTSVQGIELSAGRQTQTGNLTNITNANANHMSGIQSNASHYFSNDDFFAKKHD